MNKLWVNTGVFLILAFLGLLLAFTCLSEVNSTSLLIYYDHGVYSSFVKGPLVPGQIVRGEFKAKYDNLGMVKLRIRTFNRINTTHIRFVIRERGSDIPLATNIYALDRFPDGLLYPFGFPVITGSKGKTYEFTLESQDGSPDNAIGIVYGYHDVASQYVFQKSQILPNRTEILHFISEKAKNMLSDPYTILYISIFLVPAFVYLFRRFTVLMAAYALLMYTYIPVTMHSNTALVIATMLTGIVFFTQSSASRIYIAALIWLVQIPVLLAFGDVLSSDRAATLVFFLTLIGGIISLADLRKK